MQLNSILHRLGSPSEHHRRVVRRWVISKWVCSLGISAVACSHRNTIVNNRLEEYLLQTSREIDKQALKEIKAKEVFLLVS